MRIPFWLNFNLAIAFAFLVLFAFQQYVIFPIQDSLITWGAFSGSLLFLPHGIRVFAVMTGGTKVAGGLLLGHWAAGYFVTKSPVDQNVIQGLLSILAVYLPFYLFKFKEINLKNILLLAAVSSLVNSQLQTIYLSFSGINGNVYLIFSYLIGDLLGSLACFYLFKSLPNILRRYNS